jgi:hypothetical protein
MQRLIVHASRLVHLAPGRRIALAAVTATLSFAVLPAFASATTQTLTVAKAGTGTGTVTSSPAGINCGSTCSAPFTEGSTVVLKAVSGPNTAAVKWSSGCEPNLENECKITMSAAKTVTATFNLLERPLTVKNVGTGSGTVTSFPTGINCGLTCSASFVKETTVTLTGVSNGGTKPVIWSGCGSVTGENKCVVTMSTAKTVTATFDLPSFQLTVSKVGTGTGTVTSSPAGIECGGTCSAPFAEKSTVTLSGAPGLNTEPTIQWTGCTSVIEGKCLVTMDKAKSVTATFTLVSHLLSVTRAGAGTGTVTSSPAGINCGLTCSASFEHGTLVTLTGTAGLNTDPAVQWSGCNSVDAEGKCLVTMSAVKTVTATFNVIKWPLAVTKTGGGTGTVTSSPAGLACGATCSASFTFPTTVTLEGSAGFHTRRVRWSGCDSIIKTGNKCVVAMTSAKTVIANFELESQYIEHTVTLQLKGTGKGTVTSSPAGINCGEDCSEKYLHRKSLRLIATPAPGSVFDHWAGGGCTGQTGPCEGLISSTRLIRAYFVAVGKRTLTIAKAGTGSGMVTSKQAPIECGTACSAEIEASTKVALKAIPNKGSKFTGWSGERCSGTGACRVTMNETRNVTATFATVPVPPGVGSLSVAGAATVKGGKALLRLSCAGGPCSGTLMLLLRIRNAQGKVKRLVIAVANYSLDEGATATLAATLSSKARRQLRSAGQLWTRVSGPGVVGAAVKLKLVAGAHYSRR